MSSFVQANVGSSTNASSATITLASAPVSGDVLCIFVVTSTTATFTPSDSQGNVWRKGTGVFNGIFSVYVAISNGVAGTYTATVGWTSGAGTKTFAIGEWLGPPNATFLNGPPWNASKYTDDTGGGVSFTAPGPGALAVLFSYAVSNAAPATTGTGVVQRLSNASLALGDVLSTAGGSQAWGDGTSTGSPFEVWAASVIFQQGPSVIFDAMNE